MGLMPLEFKDCLTDSPLFRQKLQAHERELDSTSRAIKGLIKDVTTVFNAAKNLSHAQNNLSKRLNAITLECIGGNQTDDEIFINQSVREFAKIIDMIEDERTRMLETPVTDIIKKLECFRKSRIGKAKEGRKKFHKETQKFYQSQERYLNMSTKKDSLALQEADATLEMEQRYFVQASLDYVFLLQEVQERKKFEFVEILLRHMLAWLAFYHQGHEVFKDCKPYMNELQERLQKTKENFDATSQEASILKDKTIQIDDPGSMDKTYTRQGYLYLMEKKAFGTTWTKQYCQYQKKTREFTMIPFNQIQQKMANSETVHLKSCIRRPADSIDKRFCFDLTAQTQDKDKPPPPQGVVYTLQALSEDDCKKWLDAMDGKELLMHMTGSTSGPREVSTSLDENGRNFISKAIAVLESKGLEDQGMYRIVGVTSKVNKLLNLGLDPSKSDKIVLDDPSEWEVKTITSAIKQYFRNLPEPLMTYDLHSYFIASAKKEKLYQRVSDIHKYVYRLPETNLIMLKTLLQHLRNVAEKSDKNLMTVGNLGVCFGPTLLKSEEESVAAIMDIKFCNIVVEILIEHFDKIFNTSPNAALDLNPMNDHPKHSSTTSTCSSSPKSSPTPSGQSPSNPSMSFPKNSQPVLQTVVTSFTTSEPQTVHFGDPNLSHPSNCSPSNALLQRSDGTSNLKVTNASDRPCSGRDILYFPSLPHGRSHSGVPPPPSATAWNHSIPSSSLNSGINSVGLGSPYDTNLASAANNNNLQRNRLPPSRPPPPVNGQMSRIPPGNSVSGPSILFVNPLTEHRGEGVGSSSSSCESLSSRSSRDLLPPSHPNHSNSSPQTSSTLGTSYPPTYRQHMETRTSLTASQSSSALPTLASGCVASASSLIATSSSSSISNGVSSASSSNPTRTRVRTLYACMAENDSELSFEPNQILTNVRPSKEPGWLEGTLNGKSGLIPENYVEYIDDKGSLPSLISHRNTDV